MAFLALSFIPNLWRTPKVIIALLVLEIPLTIAALALFGIADPDLYRTSLWQEGANHGWNSNPNEILYAYANYRPISVPLPWSQFITNWNVVIAVLSMFFLLVKSVMFVMHTFPPILSFVVHATLIALYAVSIHGQAAPDMSDPQHPSKVPWYLRKSCGPPVSTNLKGYCMQAKGSFGVTCCLFGLFFFYLIFSAFSLIPSAAWREKRQSKASDAESFAIPQTPRYEMSGMPATPGSNAGLKSPMTPRTMAFNTLDGSSARRVSNRDLPLRHHISMGEETYKGKYERWG
ncbi:hypothetical protein MMC20_007399 [Loxospora ochrophaea]|nr:hypothetical protein [Loxospora ochrophaea]